MGYNKEQFGNIIEITLNEMGEKFTAKSAINLLLGTAAHESRFGRYLYQVRGPALGAFQVEPNTFYWLRGVFAPISILGVDTSPKEMVFNLKLSIIVARLRYWVVPLPLPKKDDIEGLAWYWKKYYNTYKGAGKPSDFIKAYREFVLE